MVERLSIQRESLKVVERLSIFVLSENPVSKRLDIRNEPKAIATESDACARSRTPTTRRLAPSISLLYDTDLEFGLVDEIPGKQRADPTGLLLGVGP